MMVLDDGGGDDDVGGDYVVGDVEVFFSLHIFSRSYTPSLPPMLHCQTFSSPTFLINFPEYSFAIPTFPLLTLFLLPLCRPPLSHG